MHYGVLLRVVWFFLAELGKQGNALSGQSHGWGLMGGGTVNWMGRQSEGPGWQSAASSIVSELRVL